MPPLSFSFLFLFFMASVYLSCSFPHCFFPFSPLPHAALGAFGKPTSYQEWSFGLCWLWLCGEVPVETNGAKFFSRSAPVFVQLRWGWSSSGGPLVLFMKNILTSFDKYGFKIWTILSAKRLTSFIKWEAQKTFCLANVPFTLWPCCKSRLTLMVVMINLLFLLSFHSERLFIHCLGQDQLLTLNRLLFYSFLGFSRSFSWGRKHPGQQQNLQDVVLTGQAEGDTEFLCEHI